MLLKINFKAGKPVHLQVVDQIKTAAASGALRQGEALPSIGRLAEELHVNQNSVAKAGIPNWKACVSSRRCRARVIS